MSDGLEAGLRAAVEGEVRFDAGSLAAYSTDASNYRQVPIGVVVPRTVEAAAAALDVCRRYGAPVLSRGGGTSLAGQCTNTAVVIDWSKHCGRLVSLDPQARRCVVEPGIVLDDLNAQLAGHGLMFGPKPATHDHCTLGGMIGNNSCGSTAQAYGKTADNVRRLEVMTYAGWRGWVGPTSEDELASLTSEAGPRAQLYRGLQYLRETYGTAVRDDFPDIPRRVSGYSLDALLPEQGFDVARLLVGSESTLATVLRAELELVPTLQHTAMAVLGFPDVMAAADAVGAVLDGSPVTPVQVEAMDDRLTALMHQHHVHADSLELLPDGNGWLMVQFGGDSRDEARTRAEALVSALDRQVRGSDVMLTDDPARQATVLAARESALGLAAHPAHGPQAWAGWEDSAVPPRRLGDYLRDLTRLFDEHHLEQPTLYGHFGHGCVHLRLPFRLESTRGIAQFRTFLEDAADLVTSYGGSLSGEHGDGQARGELLARMFSPEVMRGFGEVKALFDPDDRMNPGKVVAPHRLDDDLRLGASWRPRRLPTTLAYPEDGGSFTSAALRCVGVGQCRRQQPDGGVMCPSYQVTREEEHSTRGRARLLFEMLEGHEDSPIEDGWQSEAVRDALDLCLACKGCLSDCPVHVDMATYKVEFLHQHYRHRPRPRAHYALGWLPTWAGIAAHAPGLVNAALRAPLLSDAGKHLAGIAPQRQAPLFADETLRQWWQGQRGRGWAAQPGDRHTVVLWPDTFTDAFEPAIGKAAVALLEGAGYTVVLPTERLCCGLTWISTGQLTVARRRLRATVRALRPWLEAGHLVVGLEPSCTAVFRSDSAQLLPDDRDVARLREQAVTLAEALLRAPHWEPEPLQRNAIVQTHCHQHAVLGTDADTEVMRRAGLHAQRLDSGCCGLAGNFGFEDGHYDVSMACAEQALLPAVRAAGAGDLVLADGFSCRTQIAQGDTGRRAIHLAQALTGRYS